MLFYSFIYRRVFSQIFSGLIESISAIKKTKFPFDKQEVDKHDICLQNVKPHFMR